MSLLQVIRHPYSLLHDLALKKAIKQFAHKFELVYFGYVDQREDEHELVRGITLSANHVDNHYTVGHFRGHDVTLVVRRDTVSFPNKPSQDYTWAILQVDLKKAELPHIFIDANHHDETFYANLFVKFVNFQRANQLFANHDQLFNKYFKVYTPPDKFDQATLVLKPEVTSMLAYHFHSFDFEMYDDRLLIYASNAIITSHVLQDMMRVGVWLGDQLNTVDLTHIPEAD